MIAKNSTFFETTAPLCASFFEKYPNDDLRDRVSVALATIMKRQKSFPGKPEGWAAGIVFALGSRGCGIPEVLNNEFAQAFGVDMSTVYKRAWAIKRLLGMLPPGF